MEDITTNEMFGITTYEGYMTSLLGILGIKDSMHMRWYRYIMCTQQPEGNSCHHGRKVTHTLLGMRHRLCSGFPLKKFLKYFK